ncbi:MAG: COX15/CtaA family protein [Candidatus Rokubacteria bacterium]|nr:COX15/CtaA family protein [Candidatus Rokubacteria bacterium]
MTHRLALVTVAATLVVLVFGGLVTNTGAALAVPDWPTTFGYNMFLYPWAQMVGGVFYEHSHRLLGSVVGLLTLALAAALWRTGGRVRWLGLAAVVAVVVQGVLGGLRVLLLEDALAIVHGCVAQAFFALLATLALLTSPRAQDPGRRVEPSTRKLAVVAAALVYLQIVLGALLTHAGWIDLHLVGAAAVFTVVPMVTARVRRSGDPVAAPIARALIVLVVAQLVLGAGSYLARFSGVWIPGEQLTVLALPVAHRAVAALILAASVVLAVRLALAAESREGQPEEHLGVNGRTHPAPMAGPPRLEPASRTPRP